MTLSLTLQSFTSAFSPVTAVNSNNFITTSGSLVVVLWAGNSSTATVPTSGPTITDNLGVHLNWTRRVYEYRGSTFTADGQAAIFTAPVITGSGTGGMNLTVTNNATGFSTAARLDVFTVTDSNGLTPGIGTASQGGQSTGTGIPMAYTAAVTGSKGFGVVCDWDVKGSYTAGTGTTLQDGGTVSTSIGFANVTQTGTGTATSTTTLNVTIGGGASTNIQWAALEITPGGTGSSGGVESYLNTLRNTRDAIALDLGTDTTLGSVQMRALSDADLTCVAMVMKALVDKGLMTASDFTTAMAATVAEGTGWLNLSPLA